jgi:predicted transglutaminase-like cysteine proteinase
MKTLVLVLTLALAACSASGSPVSPVGQTSQEVGFSAFCAAHPHQGTCP